MGIIYAEQQKSFGLGCRQQSLGDAVHGCIGGKACGTINCLTIEILNFQGNIWKF